MTLEPAASTTSTKAYYKNCGEDPKSSINEIHGCNLQLEEEQTCSFSDYYDDNNSNNNEPTAGSTPTTTTPETETESLLSLSLARPIQSNDDRMVTLYYYTCTVQTAANNDCTNVETVFLYGNAVARIDDMLIQRQPQPQSQSTSQDQAIATTTTTTPPPTIELDDRICFVWDHLDGNAPLASTKNDCQYKCVTLTKNNFNREIIFNTDTSHSYYGSVTRNRHVTIVETGIRSSATTASLLGIGIIGTMIIMIIFLT